MTSDIKIVFVSHNASRSGAPIILLELIRAFKKITGFRIGVLIMEDGELTSSFSELAETYVWYKKPRYLLAGEKGIQKWINRGYYFLRGRLLLYRIGRPDVVFLNTITNGLVQPLLSPKAKGSITYVHELEGSVSQMSNPGALKLVKEYTGVFWAGSEAVKSFLTKKLAIDSDRIQVHYSSLPVVDRRGADFAAGKTNLLTSYGWEDCSILIGVLAAAESRKGFDLFFPLVSVYFSLFPESRAGFVWKGVGNRSLDAWNRHDLEKSGLGSRVRLVQHGKDNLEMMSCIDIHLLLSREDPYPLVVMEAASFGVCTICFENAGGAPEFVGNDAGYCLPYGDLVGMARAIRHLELNPQLRKGLGEKAREKLGKGHSSEQAAEALQAVIEKLIRK